MGRRVTFAELVSGRIDAALAELSSRAAGAAQGADPEDLHRFRVAARRLRSDLKTLERLADGTVDELRDELKWLGQVAGRPRDLDVLGAHLQQQVRELATPDQAAGARLVTHIDGEAREARADLATAVASARFAALVTDLRGAVSAPPVADDLAGRRVTRTRAAKIVRRPYRQLQRALEGVGADAADEELHRARIRAKRTRYAAELMGPIVGKPAWRLAHRAEALQDVLGEHQDAVVAETWLRAVAASDPDLALVAGELIEQERARRRRARRAWPHAWQRAHHHKVVDWLG